MASFNAPYAAHSLPPTATAVPFNPVKLFFETIDETKLRCLPWVQPPADIFGFGSKPEPAVFIPEVTPIFQSGAHRANDLCLLYPGKHGVPRF
jgi:hypothetical protein